MIESRIAFDLLGDLPNGTTVLEASAGTGKTFAIVGLAVRFVAEGVADVSQLLLVTFSRMATRELKERARQRFNAAAAQLTDIGVARESADEVIRHLATGTASEVDMRRRRLIQALSEFDSATIATTHSFCQQMLDGLGIAGDLDPGVTVVESTDELAAEVFDDLYLERYSRSEPPPFTIADARLVGRAASADRHARLAPDIDSAGVAGERVRFAEAARAEIQRRKRIAGIRDFDDLVVLLHGVLTDSELGDVACRRMRNRFKVVLVDEFQDTDPLQWDILRLAFHGNSTLVLVGDPKQAIYAFRGAEVLSYVDAVGVADNHRELTTNWRTDADLVRALDHLYGGIALGHPDIVVHPVNAHHRRSRLSEGKPFRLRYMSRTGVGALGRSGFPAVNALRERVARDVADDIVSVLSGGARLILGSNPRGVQPGDIAVLTRTRAQASLIRDALDRCDVPSVLAGGTSVFATEAAQEWLWLLQALEQPHRSDRVKLAAMTTLLGWTPEQLDLRGDDAVSEISAQLRDLASVLAISGFAAVFDRLSARTRLEKRLLGTATGERRITDLRHIAQLLNQASVQESLGLTALTRWIGDRIAEPTSGSVDRSRRLDSDAAAVQITTIHASKGLEFPLVYLPFAWDAAKNPKQETFLLHGPGGQRVLDVGGAAAPGLSGRKRAHDGEEAGEDLRLTYVALTRAMCRVVLWWAPGASTDGSPLQRVIGGRQGDRAEVPTKVTVPKDAAVDEWLSGWAAQASEVISLEKVSSVGGATVAFSSPKESAGMLECAQFGRVVDTAWRRTSYSAMTRSVHGAPPSHLHGVDSEVEDPELEDEPADVSVDLGIVSAPSEMTQSSPISSPMNGLPAGAAFGTLVHEILELVDTDVPDLRTELVRCCAETISAALADLDPAHLASALVDVMETPIRSDGLSLAKIPSKDRLTELDFELPLAGGESPGIEVVTLQRIAVLMRTHLSPGDALAEYPDLLSHIESGPLRGYLTGSIDAVLRVDSGQGDHEYVIVDYKTNRLVAGDLTTSNFSHAAMAQEMMQAHYPLQALLYAVALHRYLRWRQPGYEPSRHLGGVKYLFVRGMAGDETPAGCGVFDWLPSPGLIVALSELLSGEGGEIR